MKKIITSVLLITITFNVYAYSDDIDMIIGQYKNGNYEQAAELLESIKNKDARIYYYMGLSYFKAGNKKMAKKYFLSAYYIAPKSRWGKAAYKNYVYLAKDKLHFLLISGLSYDSNASNLPDEGSEGTGETYADLYFKSSYNILSLGSVSYSYSRNQYFSDDISSDDNHNLGLGLYKDNNELYVGTSYSTLEGIPLNITENISYRRGLLGFKAVNKTYYDEYDHLTGFELSGNLRKKLGNTNIEYSYLIADAKDINEYFTYQVAEGTSEDIEYVFSEVATVFKYFLSSSYNSHLVRIGNRFKLNNKTTVRISSSYRIKTYTDTNYWYNKYWLNDTGAGIWYYYDPENEEWIESPVMPPGERLEKLRKDSKLDLKICIIHRLSHNADIEIAYLYEQNTSNMNAGDIYDYNWNKGIPAIKIYYSF
ncbi:hypothetical protein ACFLUV_00435 [Elusimicrobiota bacterium]